jgi:hypothetical protein
MSERLKDDVRGTVAFSLGELRLGLLATVQHSTPIELVDTAIAGTLEVMEQHFQLISDVVVDDQGCPLQITGLVDEYWDMVNDDGGYDKLPDLRKVWTVAATTPSPE